VFLASEVGVVFGFSPLFGPRLGGGNH